MSFVSVDQVSEKQAGAFFVPMFEVRVQGVGLPEYVMRDIIEISYKDNIDEMDSFEITVNNWDLEQLDFKYIGAKEENGPLFKLFEPCAKDKQVIVKMGYAGYMQEMVVGFLTTMEPTFPSSGGSTLTVRGLSVLHQLRRKKYDGAWPKNGVRTASDIALDLNTLRDPESKQPRFPLPIAIDEEAKHKEKDVDFITQKKEYDIDFLWKLARKEGYVVCIEEASTEEPVHPRQLYFGPSRRVASPANYTLARGKSLIDFKPTLTTANQFKSVTVNGWDRKRQNLISVTIGLDDYRIKKR
jgi:phage protein D